MFSMEYKSISWVLPMVVFGDCFGKNKWKMGKIKTKHGLVYQNPLVDKGNHPNLNGWDLFDPYLPGF